MLNFLDVYERAVKGPIMSERDFDMKWFVPTLNKVVRTYGIKYDRENPVPSDDKAADVLYQAVIADVAHRLDERGVEIPVLGLQP